MLRPIVLLALCSVLSFNVHAQSTGSTLKRITDSRSITLGHRTDSAPFSFVGDDRQAAGYSVDLCKRVVASLQQQLKLPEPKVKWVPVTAESRMSEVAKGEIDLECGTTTATWA